MPIIPNLIAFGKHCPLWPLVANGCNEELFVKMILTQGSAISIWEQLNHIKVRNFTEIIPQTGHANGRLLYLQEARRTNRFRNDGDITFRRNFAFDPFEGGTVLGVPSKMSHLPAAEPILPGHTLLRPALGMLKSAVKFPHRENEDGEGVYGNANNLGLRYDGRNERVLYSGFRRMPSDDTMNPYVDLAQALKTYVNFRRNENNDADAEVQNSNNDNVMILEDSKEDDDEKETPETEHHHHDESQEGNVNQNWFWNTKDMFNHINLNQNAPEYSEVFPTGTEKSQEWSYYDKNGFASNSHKARATGLIIQMVN